MKSAACCVFFWTLIGLITSAYAERDPFNDQFFVKDGAILCESSFSLGEAIKAMGDPQWMKQIHCIRAERTSVIKIEPDYACGSNGPWKVRYGGQTLYGEVFSFEWPDGTNAMKVGIQCK